MGFNFYDYDSNGSIGSVDIINLYKYLPQIKLLKITRKFKHIYQLRLEYFAAKKLEKEIGKKSKKVKLVEFDSKISEDGFI